MFQKKSFFWVDFPCVLDVGFRCAFHYRMRFWKFLMSFSVSKKYSVATDGEIHTQNAHPKRKCNRPLTNLFCHLFLNTSHSSIGYIDFFTSPPCRNRSPPNYSALVYDSNSRLSLLTIIQHYNSIMSRLYLSNSNILVLMRFPKLSK
jgi:hypothetical protein